MIGRQLKKRLNHLLFASLNPERIHFSPQLFPFAHELENKLDINLSYYLSHFCQAQGFLSGLY